MKKFKPWFPMGQEGRLVEISDPEESFLLWYKTQARMRSLACMGNDIMIFTSTDWVKIFFFPECMYLF